MSFRDAARVLLKPLSSAAVILHHHCVHTQRDAGSLHRSMLPCSPHVKGFKVCIAVSCQHVGLTGLANRSGKPPDFLVIARLILYSALSRPLLCAPTARAVRCCDTPTTQVTWSNSLRQHTATLLQSAQNTCSAQQPQSVQQMFFACRLAITQLQRPTPEH